MVYSNETGEQKEVIKGGVDARYVPTGHLVYRRESTLMAAPFDLDNLAVTGPSVPVLEGVAGGGVRSPAKFTFAGDGTMVYMPGTGSRDFSLVWTDHKGNIETLTDRHGEYRQFALSPSNDRVAITVHEEADDDIWILQRQRDILRPLTFDPADDEQPVWGPDERWIVFGSDRDNEHDVPNLFRVHADFTGTPQRLTTREASGQKELLAPIDIAAMSNSNDLDDQDGFHDCVDDSVIADPDPS